MVYLPSIFIGILGSGQLRKIDSITPFASYSNAHLNVVSRCMFRNVLVDSLNQLQHNCFMENLSLGRFHLASETSISLLLKKVKPVLKGVYFYSPETIKYEKVESTMFCRLLL